MKIIGACLLVLALAAPSAAQDEDPSYAIRLFGFGASQSFAAKNTFNAVFGDSRGAFWGGGLEVVHRSGIFVDAEISKFSKDGQRAFISNGQAFQLGFPLTASIVPIDIMGGYRYTIRHSRFTPYAEAGATSYHYKESSPSSAASENTDTSKTGFIVAAGVEVKLLRAFEVSGEVTKTRVTGIIGSAGVSQQEGESDLGGFATRIRITIGR